MLQEQIFFAYFAIDWEISKKMEALFVLVHNKLSKSQGICDTTGCENNRKN